MSTSITLMIAIVVVVGGQTDRPAMRASERSVDPKNSLRPRFICHKSFPLKVRTEGTLETRDGIFRAELVFNYKAN